MRTLVLLALAFAPVQGREFTEVSAGWEWQGQIARGKSVEIRGVTGDIHAIPAVNGQVEVLAHVDGDTEPGAVEIRALEHLSGVTICAVRRGASACADDALTTPGARVDYIVRVPSGVHLTARTVNGGIEAESLASDVDATTVNGAVIVSTSGTVQAHTVNGSIEASLMKPFWSKSPEFSAVNGKISVKIPTNVQSAVRAETRNGKIVTDVPKFRGKATEQLLDGQIGGAGGCSQMIIRTINGTIELRQRF
jgi:hypothetical protein